jgi:monolysocardiolipin acyltransferase
MTSSVIMGLTGLLSRAFLYGLNVTKVNGLDGFVKLLNERQEVEGRERGLITSMTWNLIRIVSVLDADWHSFESY